MGSVGTPDPNSAWLSDEELAEARRRLPLLYVEAVPVRVDGMGVVTSVGLLLRANPHGAISRTVVSGRVMYGETIRDALFRHLEKDLGPMAFPQVPASPIPFQVAEYFPIPGLSPDFLRSTADQGTLFGLMSAFSGGALGQTTIFALGIMPYISASIIFSMLTKVSPTLEAVAKEGASEIGRAHV